jgi:hypothetical protein
MLAGAIRVKTWLLRRNGVDLTICTYTGHPYIRHTTVAMSKTHSSILGIKNVFSAAGTFIHIQDTGFSKKRLADDQANGNTSKKQKGSFM